MIPRCEALRRLRESVRSTEACWSPLREVAEALCAFDLRIRTEDHHRSGPEISIFEAEKLAIFWSRPTEDGLPAYAHVISTDFGRCIRIDVPR